MLSPSLQKVKLMHTRGLEVNAIRSTHMNRNYLTKTGVVATQMGYKWGKISQQSLDLHFNCKFQY